VTRVLVVDDEPHLLRALAMNLTSRGFDVSTAASATRALEQIRRLPPDLLVLDLGLPDLDGLEVIRELRDYGPELPIIVLSARGGSQDKVDALDLGAVDYVTKPFDMNEFIGRLRAILRRTTLATQLHITIGTADIDLNTRTAQQADGTDIHLTRTEWLILEVLLRQPGRLVTARELLTAVRGDPEHTDSSYLRIYLAQLRRKLEPEPSRPRYLLTEPGMGYRFQP
jgi:two-component system, OmpR family, KDP operon response regulator KdpE